MDDPFPAHAVEWTHSSPFAHRVPPIPSSPAARYARTARMAHPATARTGEPVMVRLGREAFHKGTIQHAVDAGECHWEGSVLVADAPDALHFSLLSVPREMVDGVRTDGAGRVVRVVAPRLRFTRRERAAWERVME